jgi:hypothetical protein
MPTAIVRICTPEGIVIAADGLESSSFFQVKKLQLQKIYPVHNLPLAYAIFGSTGAQILRPSKVVIDLVEEANKAEESLRGRVFDDLALYAKHFAQPIQEALLAKIGDDSTMGYPTYHEPVEPGQTVMHIFFFGYYRGLASTVDLRIFHRNHILAEPSVAAIDVDIGSPPWIRGSVIIAKLLFESDDQRFSAYRRPFPDNPAELTIGKAAEIAGGYIRACSSNVGREADPDVAISIGGHIHIAKITPLEGFQWIIPPKEEIVTPKQ